MIASSRPSRAPRWLALLTVGLGLTLLYPTPSRADDALPPGHPPIAHGGIKLPADLRLHGRFDIAYERHGYSSDLTEGKDAFRNFHRFLFLDRATRDDPFFFKAELLALTFFEIGARFRGPDEDIWRLTLGAGKVLVPFGADPLFHHAYGGRVGQDQRVLPLVWAEYGLKAQLALDLAPVGLRFDAYLIRGHALRAADGILSLQANVSPLDEMNVAGGGRISASYGPATVSYSVYGSSLDFDRSVFMQAFDLTVWRIPGVPVLEDVALSFGLLRADVSGGELDSYYHFADYLQVRYYPVDWLYVQYRGGLDMRDNRSGLFADPDRLDRFDTTAHSVSVGFLHRGLSFVVQHLWQLELVDEQPDDFFRLTVAYEF